MSYGSVMEMEEHELAVFSRVMIEPLAKMDRYEPNEGKRGLWTEFINNQRHICKVNSYMVRGLRKEVQGRAACWCYCPSGPICNCGCGSILTILMEFRENQLWRTIGPNIPKIGRYQPIKEYMFTALKDPDLFHNVKMRNRTNYPR